jgi:glyoxylase-like metal-dependent hydrolase (beta-lactamase superfamily II)
MQIKSFYDKDTATITYIVIDESTKSCAIIDSVMDFDLSSGKVSSKSADNLINFIAENNLKLEWILETHIHADHLTAASYIKEKIGGKTAIGKGILEVLKFWVPIFNSANDTALDGSQFDHLFVDGEKFKIGNLEAKVIYTPGHTPSCASYLIDDAIFVGDIIFMPEIGTARTDFPGGSADILYDSIQKVFALSDDVRIFTCHDYPQSGKDATFESSVLEQKQKNILVNSQVDKKTYVENRNKRDFGKAVPKLIMPALQVNLRCGKFGDDESNGKKYIKIPLEFA